MADAGRVLIIPKGAYNSETVYEPLDLVFYDHKSWVARKNNVGIVPSETSEEYWYKLVDMDVTASLDETVEGKVLDATAGKVLKGLIDETRTGLSEEIESTKTAIDEEIVEVQTVLEEAIDEKIAKSDALSKEEIAASTDLTGKVPSAEAFSKLNSDLKIRTKGHLINVNGTTDSYGIITVNDRNITDFANIPYCITNYSHESSKPYSITVDAWTATNVSFRIRKMSDNTVVGNTQVSFTALLLGF